jgi:hypothetical protein
MGENWEDLLNHCIDRILQGESLEECLKRYPEQAEQLEPLLRVALAARQATAVQPRPEFKARLRYQLLAAASAREKKVKRISLLLGWQRRWAVAIVTFLFLLLAGGGTVFASTNSLPDEPLYPVKLAVEQVRLTLARSRVEKARLHIQFAAKRMKEIKLLAEREKPERVEKAILRLDQHLRRVAQLAGAEWKHLLAEEELRSLAQQRDAELAEPSLPQEVLERERSITELKRLLKQDALRHREMLKRMIERRAPPPLKETLKHALERAQMGYQQALQAVGEDLEQEQNDEFPHHIP